MEFIAANSAMIKKRNLGQTAQAKNLYKYSRDKEEEIRILKYAERNRLYLIIGSFLFVVVIMLIIMYYYHGKKKLLDIILEKEDDINNAHDYIRMQDSKITEADLLVKAKEVELLQKIAINKQLLEQCRKTEDEYNELLIQNIELTRANSMDNIAADAAGVIERFKKASCGKCNLTDSDWKELLGAVDKYYPDFTLEVQRKFKRINQPMLRVCYLMKAGFTSPQITNITGYPRQTVWDRIRRIENVMGW